MSDDAPLGTPLNDAIIDSLSEDQLTAAFRELEQQRMAVKVYQDKLVALGQFINAALRAKIGLRGMIDKTGEIMAELHPDWYEEEDKDES